METPSKGNDIGHDRIPNLTVWNRVNYYIALNMSREDAIQQVAADLNLTNTDAKRKFEAHQASEMSDEDWKGLS